MLGLASAHPSGSDGARIITLEQAQHAVTEMAAAQIRRSLRKFCKRAWTVIQPQPPIWNWHMDAICDHLAYLTMGEIRFLMIGVPPRHSKTMLASVLWPAWHWLHQPGEQFLTAMLNDQLARSSALLERRLIESAWWRQHFGDEIDIYDDENQAGLFRNTKGGYRQIASTQGNVTGLGGSIQIGDDFHDAKKVESDLVRTNTISWHDNAFRSRLNNPETARKLYIGQRTHSEDVYGHVIEQEGHRWVVVNLPMEFNPKNRCITFRNRGEGPLKDEGEIFHDPRTKEGEILDPKRFSAKTAMAEKAIMSERGWQSQYNQEPVGIGGLILKRGWWKPWVNDAWRKNANVERPMPQFSEVIQVYDTAFEEDEEADFCARTTWGVFRHTEMVWDENLHRAVQGQTRTCSMLLDAMCEKFTYPDLRQEVIDRYNEFDPSWILVEKKSSGHDLINELRRKRLPIKAVGLAGSSGRGRGQGDLIARANSASLMLEKGCIYYSPRTWAHDVIEKASKFPNGPPGSRDIVSTLVIAWQYLRRYYDLELPDDEKDEINPWAWRQQPRKKYA